MKRSISSLNTHTSTNRSSSSQARYLPLADLFDRRLIATLRQIANATCADLGVKYRSFQAMKPEDSLYPTTAAYESNGEIYIRLRNPHTNKHHALSYLIDSVIHECIHLVSFKHDRRFWKLHRKCLTQILKELKI